MQVESAHGKQTMFYSPNWAMSHDLAVSCKTVEPTIQNTTISTAAAHHSGCANSESRGNRRSKVANLDYVYKQDTTTHINTNQIDDSPSFSIAYINRSLEKILGENVIDIGDEALAYIFAVVKHSSGLHHPEAWALCVIEDVYKLFSDYDPAALAHGLIEATIALRRGNTTKAPGINYIETAASSYSKDTYRYTESEHARKAEQLGISLNALRLMELWCEHNGGASSIANALATLSRCKANCTWPPWIAEEV